MFESLTRRFSGILGGIAGRKITEKNIKETLREIRVALLEADVSIEVIKDFLKRVEEKALGDQVLKGVDPGQQFIYLVYQELVELMGPIDPGIRFQEKGITVILMAGLQGSGKTTTCGKLALMMRKKHKRKPLLVAADVRRPAAIEQLKTLGSQLDVPVFSEDGLAPPKICANAVKQAESLGCDTVILDTAGRLHIDEEMMAEVRDVAARTKPHEVFLVCDAMVGQDAVKSAKEFNESLELTGVILTKLDGDARGGAAISVRSVTGKPIRFIGTGEKLDGTLEEFRAEGMAQRILGFGDVIGLVGKVSEEIEQEEAKKLQDDLLKGTFTFEDFLKQLKHVKRMGNLKDLMSMVPGMSNMVGDMDVDEKDLVHMEAIIQSMSVKERRRPEILNTSRRDRIAKGAGVERPMVDDLIKQFSTMKKMMDELGRAGGRDPLGKLKALGQAKKKMGDIGGMMEHMMAQGAPPAAQQDGAQRKRKGSAKPPPSKDELKKKRKAERKNRRKNRKK